VYAASERLIDRYGQRNRFYMIETAPPMTYDFVILGASHATVFDFDAMNAELERMTGTRILNLSVAGAGVVVNRLLFDYALRRHETRAVVYVIDSFVFYSRQWNEDRLSDARLFHRAPFDPALAALLLQNGWSRRRGLDYVAGFSKINNADRFEPDIRPEETRFDRIYRPVGQIDRQRMAYLYPARLDDGVRAQRARYLAAFGDLLREARARNLRVVVFKPPLPERVYRLLPDEREFDAALAETLAGHAVEFHDFSRVGNDERFFYDSDHLNRAGVRRFFERSLAPLLAGKADGDRSSGNRRRVG
jgi:hypothetical protein